MTGHAASESSALLGVEVDIDGSEIIDELPIISRTNTFPVTSPSYGASIDVIKHHDYEDHPRSEAEERAEQLLEPEPVLGEELRKSLALIYPVVITYTLEYSPGLVCIMLVGHLDSPDTKQFVAAATLSTMVSYEFATRWCCDIDANYCFI